MPTPEKTSTIEDRLKALGIVLPVPPKPVASYIPFVLVDGQLWISGQLPLRDGAVVFKGKLGAELTVEQGAEAARLSAVNILAQAKAALGDLERIRRLVHIKAFVASVPGFVQQPQVVNGASDLLGEVLGERGVHTRTSVGAAVLPLDAAVEIEAVLAV